MSTKPYFDKVLIANRGEIALRIIRTLKELNIKSVAVYSEADSNALHVMHADEAIFIGNSPANESYLSIDNIIWAARNSGASALHPGYGFLSENYEFAKRLKKEGITLIGPSYDSIRKMGDKIEAKKIALEAGVSTVPGYTGIIKDKDEAIRIASLIGFPVLVKAAAGGGGRGMRIVNKIDDMAAAYESAQNEAIYSFNDGRLFIEKYITNPRHVEIQILADQYDNVICLGERECSIQRNHQKIIEEAPSVVICDRIRSKMYAESINLVKSVGYYSAGTIEYIMSSSGEFYFLEMNTRLQVEHPITELVTGIDIVEQMIRIAAKQKLLISQKDIKIKGTAIEARICAEDPSRNFMPSVGRITKYIEPQKDKYVRIDSGITAGSEVSMFYDPMVAKLCIHADNREDALARMKHALSEFVINGITHNMSFLEAIINKENFVSGNISTGFIEEEFEDGAYHALLTNEATEIFIATVMHIYLKEKKRSATISDQIVPQHHRIATRWIVKIDDKSYPVVIKAVPEGFKVRTQSIRLIVKSNWVLGSTLFKGMVNGRLVNVKIKYIRTGYELTYSGITVKAFVRSLQTSELEFIVNENNVEELSTELHAQLTGQVIKVNVEEGELVKVGQELVTLSAMKMENILCSERAVKIKKLHVKPGEIVKVGDILIEFE